MGNKGCYVRNPDEASQNLACLNMRGFEIFPQSLNCYTCEIFYKPRQVTDFTSKPSPFFSKSSHISNSVLTFKHARFCKKKKKLHVH